MINILAGSALPVVATIDPQTVADAAGATTDVIDFSTLDGAIGVALLGDMAAETIDFKFYVCDDDGGNGVVIKSATQLAADAGDNDNTQLVIAVHASELLADTADPKRQYGYFKIYTGDAVGGPAACVVLGIDTRYAAMDLATVQEVVQ